MRERAAAYGGTLLTGARPGEPQLLGGLSDIHRQNSDAVVSHYAIQPTFDVYATTQDRDLGAVSKDVQKVIDANSKYLPRGATVTLVAAVVWLVDR